jgi:hypothetical protein
MMSDWIVSPSGWEILKPTIITSNTSSTFTSSSSSSSRSLSDWMIWNQLVCFEAKIKTTFTDWVVPDLNKRLASTLEGDIPPPVT